MKTRLLLLVGVAVGFAALAVRAADWPQWRGPQRNGISKETGLLQEWPKDGPTLLWQVKDIGGGHSTPSVVGDRLYVLANKGLDDEFLQAREVKDGSVAWTRRLGKVGPNKGPNYPGARSTATVDGELTYALGSDGDLVCVKTADGSEVWRHSLCKDFGGTPGMWAYAESPLVDGDAVVCTPGGKEATLVALNKKDGAVIWKSAVPGGDEAAYASILAVEAGGVKQYVQFVQKGVIGVDAKTGKFLWRYEKTAEKSAANIPTPVVHDGYVYSGTGQGGGGLFKLKDEKGEFAADPIYFDKKLPTAIGGAVLIGDYLYGTNSGQGLLCVEFTKGTVKWQDKSVGAGSVCVADGRLYLHGENGEVALVEATPDGYHEKGRFAPPDSVKDRGKPASQAWAYPVVANGRLYIRDLDCLWCYDVKAAK